MKLTNRILDAIIEATGIIEAGGTDEVQGHGSEAANVRAYNAIIDAGRWACEVQAKRAAKRRKTRKVGGA